jgi:4-hydroxybenzoate polyprenyltransferase
VTMESIGTPRASVASRLRTYGSMVAFAHTVFALPFAASAVVFALAEPHVPLTPLRVAAMLGCMVCARTSAMAFNRWADRDIDARNPRTKARHVPTGAVKPGEALALALVTGAIFLALAATLGFWPAVLAPVVLAVLLGYSLAKRFTWGAHAWLGVALALAPGGAWVAMGARPNAGIVVLMVGVVSWLVGFDVLYSLQDEGFDRENGLHSIPARFGTTGALVLSAAAHLVTVSAFVGTGVLLNRGGFYFVGVALASALLVYEHALVGRGNLAKIDKAFFDANAWVSVAFFVCAVMDGVVRRH